MKYRQIKISDAKTIASLQKETISGGFLSSLDSQTLTKIFFSILSAKENFGYMAMDNNVPVGFILMTEDSDHLYSNFIKKNVFLGFRIALKKILQPKNIIKIIEHLFYPKKKKKFPKAEWLSIGVQKSYRRSGLASHLLSLAIKKTRSKGIKEFVAIVGSKLPSNKFMVTVGGKKIDQIEVHNGEKSNVYLWKL